MSAPYRGRSAAQEMGKVLGFDKDTLSRLSAIVGTWEWRDPNDTMEKQFTHTGLDLSNPEIVWLCQCDCGNTVKVEGNKLKSGNTKSCGCRYDNRPRRSWRLVART